MDSKTTQILRYDGKEPDFHPEFLALQTSVCPSAKYFTSPIEKQNKKNGVEKCYALITKI